jgi:hypothetical protein
LPGEAWAGVGGGWADSGVWRRLERSRFCEGNIGASLGKGVSGPWPAANGRKSINSL